MSTRSPSPDSTAVGRHAAAIAGQNLKPVTIELGGNAANIVFADADLDKAIGAVIKGFVFNTGQFCMGGPRLLVARELPNTVLGILAQAVPGVPVGDPRDPVTVVGPMAGARHRDKVEEYVALAATREGASSAAGSASNWAAASTTTDGHRRPGQRLRVVQEEIFGPVLTVQPFDSRTKQSPWPHTRYGLAAGVQTTDLARAHGSTALQAGIVWVNDWAMLDPAIPFGGVKDSGFGRNTGPRPCSPTRR